MHKRRSPLIQSPRFAACVLLACAMWAGGAARAEDHRDRLQPLPQPLAAPLAAVQRTALLGSDIVMYALGLLGTPYRWGSDVIARGLDCSGFVRRVFADLGNFDLPHRSDLIYREGRPVVRNDLEAGDLVFFNTMRQPFSHVAIYIGDGQFVHSPNRGGHVQIDTLDEPYWHKRYSGARRLVAPSPSQTVPAVDISEVAEPAPQICAVDASACDAIEP